MRSGLVARIVGEGHAIVLRTLPVAVVAVVLSLWRGEWFAVAAPALRIAGGVLLAAGLAVWLSAVVLVARFVPQGRLITCWPFSWVRHPLYTGVGLLVIPGLGLALGSWVWAPVGLWLYLVARVRARREDAALAAAFGPAYDAWRARVRFPSV